MCLKFHVKIKSIRWKKFPFNILLIEKERSSHRYAAIKIFVLALLLLSIFLAYTFLRKSINILNGLLAFLLTSYISISVSSMANKMRPNAVVLTDYFFDSEPELNILHKLSNVVLINDCIKITEIKNLFMM